LLPRRHLLRSAALAAAWSQLALVAGHAGPLLAQETLGPPEAFGWDWLKGHARALSAEAYVDPGDERPAQLAALDWDRYTAIRFDPAHALWHDAKLAFRAQFFHLGIFFRRRVHIHQVEAGTAQEILYDPAMFDYGPNVFDPPLPSDLGFAGFRLHFHTNFNQDVVVFQGASYFRATHWRSHYGMSCRGLAIDTGFDRPEEFPTFTRFWLEKPEPEQTVLTVYALLESPSVTGAYRFDVSPGGDTIMDVECVLYPRAPIERLGIAPMTSMFQYGENDRRVADDWRQEIHDSDGLALWTGAGEWIWRPLVNPRYVRVNSFLDENPRGFGLTQRDRVFENYQDEGAQYERRPSVWVEPKGEWGRGAVMLVEIPTPDETFDNIVAFWKPEAPVEPGQEIALAYRLRWTDGPPEDGVRVARCVATRIGQGGIIGQPTQRKLRKFVVDFAGGDLPLVPKDAPVEPVISVSRGRVEQLTALDGRIRISPLPRPLPSINGWRVTFDIEWETPEPIDIRMYLRLGPTALTETWLYQWDPPPET
jgi:glucans biosynthesis protein